MKSSETRASICFVLGTALFVSSLLSVSDAIASSTTPVPAPAICDPIGCDDNTSTDDDGNTSPCTGRSSPGCYHPSLLGCLNYGANCKDCNACFASFGSCLCGSTVDD